MVYKCNMLQVHFAISLIVFLGITGDNKKLMAHSDTGEEMMAFLQIWNEGAFVEKWAKCFGYKTDAMQNDSLMV